MVYIPIGSPFTLTHASEEVITTGANSLVWGEMGLGSEQTGAITLVGIAYSVSIPHGVSISYASIQFRSSDLTKGPLILEISAHNIANAPPCLETTSNLSGRPKTITRISWTLPFWSTNDEGELQQTPNLSSILQEIVDLPAWASGNSILLLFHDLSSSGGARRAAVSQGAPLTVEFACKCLEIMLLHLEWICGCVSFFSMFIGVSIL